MLKTAVRSSQPHGSDAGQVPLLTLIGTLELAKLTVTNLKPKGFRRRFHLGCQVKMPSSIPHKSHVNLSVTGPAGGGSMVSSSPL